MKKQTKAELEAAQLDFQALLKKRDEMRTTVRQAAAKKAAVTRAKTTYSKAVEAGGYLVLPRFEFRAAQADQPHRHQTLATNSIGDVHYNVVHSRGKSYLFATTEGYGTSVRASNSVTTGVKSTSDMWVRHVKNGTVKLSDRKDRAAPIASVQPPVRKLREAGPALPHKGGCPSCGRFHSLEEHNKHTS